MTKSNDWWPRSKSAQLEMAENWVDEFKQSADAWKIDAKAVGEFAVLVGIAKAAYTEAAYQKTRTSVSMTSRNSAFENLTRAARDMKKRYLHVPPLSEADIISLGLSVRKKGRALSQIPAARVVVEVFLTDRNELGIKIAFTYGDPGDPSSKGYRVAYKILEEGEAEPESARLLTEHFFIGKRRHVMKFDEKDSRKFVCIAARVENGDKVGPWGPIVKVSIP
jgi:hypothetical protein